MEPFQTVAAFDDFSKCLLMGNFSEHEFRLSFLAKQPIPIHAAVAVAAVLLGTVQFVLAKGTWHQRLIGYLWVSLMFIVAVTSFFINEFRWIGPFGPIHLLSLLVLHSIWSGVVSARIGEISVHRKTMSRLYIFGLIITGAFTLMPGRIMHIVFLG